jgi:predicted nucleotidyltransferase component of viral defense system
MDRNSSYFRQVQLLVRILPMIGQERCFALKGGTAINLFCRDLPRLSVDIDLVYLPIEDRETSLLHIREALSRIAANTRNALPNSEVVLSSKPDALRLLVSHSGAKVKVELSPVLRGTVFEPSIKSVTSHVEEEFGFAEIQVLTLPDLYAGKVAAALDRQHPRDFYDIKLLLENEGIDDQMRRTFLVYLISHHRPMAELLEPPLKDIRQVFESEFVNMSEDPVTLVELELARDELIRQIRTRLTEEEKAFLISFKSRSPEWGLLGLNGIEDLPAVQWKLINLRKMPDDKHASALENLRRVLSDAD